MQCSFYVDARRENPVLKKNHFFLYPIGVENIGSE